MSTLNRICNSKELENLINSTHDGEVCVLEAKEYYLTKQVVITGKKGITVDGSKATIITKYVNNDDYSASTNAFILDNCDDVTLTDITMDTDIPTNITAIVEKIDFEEKSVVLAVDKKFKINGDEVLMAFNTIDDEGSPDYHMNYYSTHPDRSIVTLILGEILLANTYSSAKYDYLGDNRFKVYFRVLSEKLSVGERMCIRHTMYGPSAITLRDSNRTLLKNITMYSVPGMGIVVLPRCNDLTLDGLKIIPKEGSNNPMPGNCDGIHLTGLHCKFVMKNCVFDGMGDDALNVHATAGTITELIDNNTIRCGYCKKGPDGTLPERWCEPGDIIKVYDPFTMVNTATLKAVSFVDGVLNFTELEGTYKKGDTMQNITYAPSCEVDNCIIRNTRARGFVIQTSNVEIKNCTFFGMSMNAIKVAPDFNYWYEVGPTYNFYMHDNIIEKCAFRTPGDPSIGIFTSHRANDETVTHLHKNIRLENNVIKRSHSNCITVTAADSVNISGNRFEDREVKDVDPIKLINCTDVKIENNTEA
jgi:hypothetical protein